MDITKIIYFLFVVISMATIIAKSKIINQWTIKRSAKNVFTEFHVKQQILYRRKFRTTRHSHKQAHTLHKGYRIP